MNSKFRTTARAHPALTPRHLLDADNVPRPVFRGPLLPLSAAAADKLDITPQPLDQLKLCPASVTLTRRKSSRPFLTGRNWI